MGADHLDYHITLVHAPETLSSIRRQLDVPLPIGIPDNPFRHDVALVDGLAGLRASPE